ncbi:MAG: hypothetical protein RI968_510 [Pseudomonadota bacterium]
MVLPNTGDPRLNIPLTREAWLLFAVNALAPLFTAKGYQVPRVRVSCAIPSTSRRGSAVGQCWSSKSSDDGVNEIFISPVHADPIEVLDTLTHELVHAVDDCAHRHGKEFKKIAHDIGLEGKMIHASAGPALRQKLAAIAVDLTATVGPYPHAAMRVPSAMYAAPRPAPKAACPQCGFRVSMLMKYLDVGPPICPKDNIPMERKGRWE